MMTDIFIGNTRIYGNN